jgi:hypothetical protein
MTTNSLQGLRAAMTWHGSNIQLQDRPAHVLVDDRFASRTPVAELPCLNWFGVWFVRPTPEDRFVPESEEEAFLDFDLKLIEIAGALSDGWAVYCLRILSRGIVEYYMYARDASTLAGLVAEFKRHYPQYRIEHDTKIDAEWSEYVKYLAAV